MSRIPLLYIHGMGGGADSRIPSILKEYYPDLVVNTYSFDPDQAQLQLKWSLFVFVSVVFITRHKPESAKYAG